MTKLQNPEYDKTKKIKLWQHSKTQIMTNPILNNIKKSNCDKLEIKILTKPKNLNSEKTKKNQIVTKHK